MNKNWQKEYPFESKFFDHDGLKQHYIDEGSGDPILMVHGNPTWSFYYRNLVSAFRDSHRMIAVDHIGCGLSDKPQKYKYRLTQHVENLKRLVTHLKLEDTTLVVHDWGGPIGLATLMHLSHRFKKVVILNTGAFVPKEIPFGLRMARLPMIGKFLIRGMNMFCKKAITTAVVDKASLSDVAVEGLLAPYDNWANRVAVHQFVMDIPPNSSHPTYGALKVIDEGLDNLSDIPVKMIWGMKDWVFTPEILAEMEKRIPHASVHKLENVGHYVMEEGRDEVIKLVGDFLNE